MLYLTVPFSHSCCCVLHGGLKWYRQLNEADGGQILVPDDQVWSAVCTAEGGKETVRLVREVHCDLLFGGGVTVRALVEQFKDGVMMLIVATTLESHKAVVQGV